MSDFSVKRMTMKIDRQDDGGPLEPHDVPDIGGLRQRLRYAAGRVVDQRTRAYMLEHDERSYARAMRLVLAADTALKNEYALGVTARE